MPADEVHRDLAVAQFNATWDLIERSGRSPDDDLEMLLSAMTSRWHWGQLDDSRHQQAVGDWQIAHVASLLGLGDVALRFARRSLATAEAEGWTGWRLASAHEGVARASAAGGDAAGRATHLAAARAALDAEPDDEERQLVAEQLSTVPEI